VAEATDKRERERPAEAVAAHAERGPDEYAVAQVVQRVAD
jgi:hypothetical protein